MDYIGSDEFRFGAGQPVDPETLRAEALARRRPLNQITTEELTRGFGFGGRSNIPGYSRAEIQAELDRRLSSQFPPGAPAQMYREEAVESTPRNLGTAPPPPPPPPPAQTTARPGAPAVGLPPRVEMGGGNISELISQRLGQIQQPQTAQSMMDNPWMALLQGGLSMMDSRGKSLAEALAGGGRSALGVLEQQRGRKETLDQQRYAREMERLKTENEMRKLLGDEEYRRAALGVEQRGQDIRSRTDAAATRRMELAQEREDRMRQSQALQFRVRDIDQRIDQLNRQRQEEVRTSGELPRARAAQFESEINQLQSQRTSYISQLARIENLVEAPAQPAEPTSPEQRMSRSR